MKKAVFLLTICMALCLIFASCGSDEDKKTPKSTDSKIEKADEGSENRIPEFDNFTGGVIDKGNNDINLKFEISSIQMEDKGLAFYYTISRDSSGYKNYYRLENMKLNGCFVRAVQYFAGDEEQEDMGKNTTGDDSLTLSFVVPVETLNRYGISEFSSFEFTLNAGYTFQSSATNEYSESFILYSGKAKDNPKQELVPADNHITLVDNDKCKIVITDTKWLTNYQDDILGQEYLMFCQAYDDDVNVSIDNLKIGDLTEQPNEYSISSNGYGSQIFLLEKNTTYYVTALWRDKGHPLSAPMFENAEWNLTLTYIDGDDETTESVSVPANLVVSLDYTD